MIAFAAIFGISNSLGYLLPAIIGLESMGIPSPGETALVAAAVLASQGKLEIGLVIAIGAVSAIVGDNIGYALGRKFGRQGLEHRGPFQKRRLLFVRAGDKFFEKHGRKAVFLARWVALVRVAAAWLAGINRMPFKVFFFWNALGGITWAITYGLVGYYVGQKGAQVLSEIGIAGAVLLVVMAVVGVIMLRRREREMLGVDDDEDDQAESDPPSNSSAQEFMQ